MYRLLDKIPNCPVRAKNTRNNSEVMLRLLSHAGIFMKFGQVTSILEAEEQNLISDSVVTPSFEIFEFNPLEADEDGESNLHGFSILGLTPSDSWSTFSDLFNPSDFVHPYDPSEELNQKDVPTINGPSVSQQLHNIQKQ